MPIVYFDRNVFDHISTRNCGVTEEVVARIQRAVDSRIITILASYTVIEETVPLVHASDERYAQHIQTVLNLIDKDCIIKPHYQLLLEDCESYAFKKPITPRTTKMPKNFRDLLDSSINNAGLKALAEEIHSFYESYADVLQTGFDGLIETTRQRFDREARKEIGTFEELWNLVSLTIVERVVNRLPRIPKRLCKKRGLENMLHIRSVRIYAIYHCWLSYTHWLKTDGPPGKVRPSECGDFFHAVCASAADIFVTQESKEREGRLPFILSQVPISQFTVMSLTEFLETL